MYLFKTNACFPLDKKKFLHFFPAEATEQRHAMDVPGSVFLGLSVVCFMRWMAQKLLIMIVFGTAHVDDAICLQLLMGLTSDCVE